VISAPSATPIGRELRELLALDRSLSPTDRKVLELLLLHPPPVPVRELSRATGTNLQALYGSIDRLHRRGLIVALRNGPTRRFRVAHPSVVLRTLLEPGERATAIAGRIEGSLRLLYERDDREPVSDSSRHARATASATAATSWLMDLLGAPGAEVWFLGNEDPWFSAGSALESELEQRRRAPDGPTVRVLVRPATGAEARRVRHDRLRRSGTAVRYSNRIQGSTVVVDRHWLMHLNPTPGTGRPVYLQLEAPELCRDLLVLAEEIWNTDQKSDPPAPGNPSALPPLGATTSPRQPRRSPRSLPGAPS
jgi:DNA-binding MarR family transcriptional regulator